MGRLLRRRSCRSCPSSVRAAWAPGTPSPLLNRISSRNHEKGRIRLACDDIRHFQIAGSRSADRTVLISTGIMSSVDTQLVRTIWIGCALPSGEPAGIVSVI